jgi:hypothetical protein
MLLLSYIPVYSRELAPKGCKGGIQHLLPQAPHHGVMASKDSEITRLDLTGALGRGLTFKQMSKDLILRHKVDLSERSPALKDAIPSSWDETPESDPVPLHRLKPLVRFENLRFLSLADPDPRNASWATLLPLLSHILTLTHLSLAYWPVPTLASMVGKTPIRRSFRSPSSSPNTTTADSSSLENDRVEILSVLRKLSRATYCLKWLDLEGCGDWASVLRWDGITADGELNLDACAGPEWNGPWRDIEWIRLGPGWKPGWKSEWKPESRTEAANRHMAQIKLHRDIWEEAEKIEKHIQRIRKEGGGKWVRFSSGDPSFPWCLWVP